MAHDLAAVEEFLSRLARAIRQYHTYPAASSMCTDAVSACHAALVAMNGRDRLTFRVTPGAMLVDDAAIAPAIVKHELARRLHAGHVSALDIDLAAAPRHLSRFCAHLLAERRTNA